MKAVPSKSRRATKKTKQRRLGYGNAEGSSFKILGTSIGFIIGKTTYADRVAMGRHPRDLPEKFLVKKPPSSPWNPRDKSTVSARYQVDACMAWKIKKSNPEFVVDIIPFQEVTSQRLRANDINFLIGADCITARFHDKVNTDKSPLAKRFLKAMKDPKSKLFVEWQLQEWVYSKKTYMTSLRQAGVPLLDTIFVGRLPDHLKLLQDVKEKGWQRFVVKPEMSSWSIGLWKGYTVDAEKDPSLLQQHFEKWQHRYPSYLVQEFIENNEIPGDSFQEIRIYWLNGEFLVAHQETSLKRKPPVPGTIGGYSMPSPDRLSMAKAIGRAAMIEARKRCTFQGRPTELGLFRTDIGVTGQTVKGLQKVEGKTMFLNEVENMACDWHTRLYLNEPKGLSGQSFKGFNGFSMLDRMAEYFTKKAQELCRGGPPLHLSWT